MQEDVPEDAEQVPVEEVGEQITPRPRELEREEFPTMLDEENFHGADLAGGEGEIPLAIMRVTGPVIRRDVRNAHYNLGHPSTATLLRIMRRSGASDAAQRYARWDYYRRGDNIYDRKRRGCDHYLAAPVPRDRGSGRAGWREPCQGALRAEL